MSLRIEAMPPQYLLPVTIINYIWTQTFCDMNRKAIIERTLKAINQLPEEKAKEVSDLADLIIKQYEEQLSAKDIAPLTSNSKAFESVKDE